MEKEKNETNLQIALDFQKACQSYAYPQGSAKLSSEIRLGEVILGLVRMINPNELQHLYFKYQGHVLS